MRKIATNARMQALFVPSWLILLYAAARVWRLTDACLWFDEMFSVHAAEQPWNKLIGFVAADLVHPPLFYIVLKLWIGIGGSALFWVRLLPVLFACMALVPLLLLCRELKLRPWTISLAVFLLSLSGILINYTQRVRMYTLLMALSLTSIWLFARYVNRGGGFVPLLIVNIALIYTQYFGVFVVGGEVLIILLLYRQKWRSAVWMSVTLFLAFLPWALIVVSAAGGGSDPKQNIGWIARPGFVEIWTFIFDLVEPVYFQFSNEEPASIYWISTPLLCLWAVVLIVFLINLKRQPERDRRLLFITVFALAPIVATFIVSWALPYSVWGARHLIVSAGPLAIAAAMVVERIDVRSFRICVASAIVILSAAAVIYRSVSPGADYLWCRWDRTGHEFSAAAKGGPARKVYAFESIIAYHLWFASREAGGIDSREISGFGPKVMDDVYFLPREFDGVRKVTADDISGERLWFVFRTHQSGEETSVFEELKRRGYAPCEYTPGMYPQTRMFVIEFVRGGVACS